MSTERLCQPVVALTEWLLPGDEERLDHFHSHRVQVAQHFFPSSICTAVLPMVHLLDDLEVTADGISGMVLCHNMVLYIYIYIYLFSFIKSFTLCVYYMTLYGHSVSSVDSFTFWKFHFQFVFVLAELPSDAWGKKVLINIKTFENCDP